MISNKSSNSYVFLEMVVKYIGFPSSLKGKKLHELALCLKNHAQGRVVHRHTRPEGEPSFWLITKSNINASFSVNNFELQMSKWVI